MKFSVPTVADGQVFVGTTNSLVAYGLLDQATTIPGASTALTAEAFSGSVINLSWTDNDVAPNSASGYSIQESTDGVTFTQIAVASAGATSYAVGGLQSMTPYDFRVEAVNALGASAPTNVASATTSGQTNPLQFPSGFSSAASVLTFNGSAQINGPSAELTDGGMGEAGSVFSTNTVPIAAFSTAFTFQLTNATADGFTFTIQGKSPTALGSSGGGLGYGPDNTAGPPGIANSLAVKFDLDSNQGEGPDSTGLFTDGAAPTDVGSINLTGSGINLHSGDVIQASLSYDGTNLTETLQDTHTGATFTHVYTNVNIPALVGGDSAYVGFTAGDGGFDRGAEHPDLDL